MTNDLTDKDVVNRVKADLKRQLQLNDVGISFKNVTFIKREEDWWYIAVEPETQPERPFRYYEALAEVEANLRDDKIYVAIVPCVNEE